MDALRSDRGAVPRARRHDQDETPSAEGAARFPRRRGAAAAAGGAMRRRGFGVRGSGFGVLVLGSLVLVLVLGSGSLAQQMSREAAARAPIAAFVAAVNASDNEALQRTLHCPHVRVNALIPGSRAAGVAAAHGCRRRLGHAREVAGLV